MTSDYTFVSSDVGNFVQHGGQRFRIDSISSGKAVFTGKQWTIDPSGTAYLGGALASQGAAGQFSVQASTQWGNGAELWERSGEYTLTNSTPNTPGGPPSVAWSSNISNQGYKTARGDTPSYDEYPIIKAGVQTNLSLRGCYTNRWSTFRYLAVDGENNVGTLGYYSTGRDSISYCYAKRCTNNGIQGSALLNCIAEDCGPYGLQANYSVVGGKTIRCGSTRGCHGGYYVHNHLSIDANGPGIGTAYSGASGLVKNCTVVGAGTYGVIVNQGGNVVDTVIIDCETAIYGYSNVVLENVFLRNNVAEYFGSGPSLTIDNRIALTADPFVDGAGGDYRPNQLDGGGALLRGVGQQGHDAGALQSAAASAGRTKRLGIIC